MMKKLVLTVCSLLFMVISVGCAGAHAENTGSTNTDTIRVAGSTTVAPLMRELRLAFEYINSEMRVEIQEIGTSSGINATIEGVSHIAMASREFSANEVEQGIIGMPIAIDGVVVIVHPENEVTALTSEEIRNIFEGNITNWSEVGGANADITVVSREDGSGIRSTFEDMIDFTEVSVNAIFSNGTGAVLNSVASNRNAIGYITAGVASNETAVRAVDIDGFAFSDEAVRNGTYPLVNTFFIGVLQDMPASAQSFVDFILSDEGQALVSHEGYVSIH